MEGSTIVDEDLGGYDTVAEKIAFEAAERYRRELAEVRAELRKIRDAVAVAEFEADTRVARMTDKASLVVSTVRRVLDNPHMKRDEVQGLLLNAIQRWDG